MLSLIYDEKERGRGIKKTERGKEKTEIEREKTELEGRERGRKEN